MNIALKISILFASCAGLALSGAAFADRDDIRMLPEARITLVEAIQIAEAHQGGIAYDAKLEDDSFTPEYEVELVLDDRFY
ncbi:MAG TPA: PepSY domain-containing protein, partial [Xanthomonadales bacterium]|nr:PepSY domain-containing protein [Xanthomonadales bacterium]